MDCVENRFKENKETIKEEHVKLDVIEIPTVSLDESIFKRSDVPLLINLEKGGVSFLVGPNGSGKSSLIEYLVRKWIKDKKSVEWESANRIDNITNGLINIDGNDYNLEKDVSLLGDNRNMHLRQESRLKRLVRKQNNFFSEGKSDIQESPIDQLNELFESVNLKIKLVFKDINRLFLKRNDYGDEYDIIRASDGEVNAIILGSMVLLADPGTYFLIDEFEKHLHRSIASSFLKALIDCRKDCFFIVSTHDLDLLKFRSNKKDKVVYLGGCYHNSGGIIGWDAREIKGDYPEDIYKSIVGNQRKILYVEGDLDVKLYRILFPEFDEVKDIGGCNNVISRVKIYNEHKEKGIEAFGLIDRDYRSEEEIENFKGDNVYILKSHDVESICYDLKFINEAIKDSGKDYTLDYFFEEVIKIEKNIENLIDKKYNLDSDVFKNELLNEFLKYEDSSWFLSFCDKKREFLKSLKEDYKKDLKDLIDNKKWDDLVFNYSIKKSGIPSRISKSLFSGTYEGWFLNHLDGNGEDINYIKDKYFDKDFLKRL